MIVRRIGIWIVKIKVGCVIYIKICDVGPVETMVAYSPERTGPEVDHAATGG